jgi:hypothetical protein
MTLTDLRALARGLGALLPQRTRGPLAEDPHAAQALAARLETACLTAGIVPRDAVLIADSLTSYLLSRGERYDTLHPWIGKGTVLLHLARGGQGDEVVLLVPYGVTLTDEAIAQLLSWALLEDLEDEDERLGVGEQWR